MVDLNINKNSEFNEDKLEQLIENIKEAQGMLTYQEDYALYVEIDTEYEDSQPPFEPIRDWVIRNITEGVITASEEEYESVDDIAWAIVNHLAENGTKGVYFVTFTKNHIVNNWENIIGNYNVDDNLNAPEDIVKDLLNEMLEYSQNKLKQEDKIDTGNLIDSGITIYGVKPESREFSTTKI